jgi:hypothetical protein
MTTATRGNSQEKGIESSIKTVSGRFAVRNPLQPESITARCFASARACRMRSVVSSGLRLLMLPKPT